LPRSKDYELLDKLIVIHGKSSPEGTYLDGYAS